MFRHRYNLDMIDPSSKMALKMSCLKACENDVERARELYEFLSADILDLPDVEPVKPSAFEQVKMGATEFFGWFTDHKDEVAQGISFIQSLRNTSATTTAVPSVPPIPKL